MEKTNPQKDALSQPAQTLRSTLTSDIANASREELKKYVQTAARTMAEKGCDSSHINLMAKVLAMAWHKKATNDEFVKQYDRLLRQNTLNKNPIHRVVRNALSNR